MDLVRRVVIGLGGNLGDRMANLEAAVARMRADGALSVIGTSPVYETPPAGGPPQGNYLNAAVLLSTALSGHEILRRTFAIERDLGRQRALEVRWGPRTIDLDLLWIEGEVIADDALVVPHPRLVDRPFALRPLLDVAPDAIDARIGTAFAASPASAVPLVRVADAVSTVVTAGRAP